MRVGAWGLGLRMGVARLAMEVDLQGLYRNLSGAAFGFLGAYREYTYPHR